MSITVVRLRPVDGRKNWGMRTYTSANSRTKYVCGTERNPSPFRIVKSNAELVEVSQFDQFEALEFDDMDQLKEFIQNEMEERARIGLPAVRAAIMTGSGQGQVMESAARPRKAVMDRLPTAVSGPADPAQAHMGRRPAAQPEPSREAAAAPQGESGAKKPRKGKATPPRKRSTRPATEGE